MKKLNTNFENRWSNYRKANNEYPQVRAAEMSTLVGLADIAGNEKVLEIGTGNGIVTLAIAKMLTNGGDIITIDATQENLDAINKKNKVLQLPITTQPETIDYNLPFDDNSFDKVITLAALHHHDNRNDKTGHTGRQKILKEIYRVLKPGGKLILGDPAYDTDTQRYFDTIDNPIHVYPTGHPHDFPTEDLIRTLCTNAGFKDVTFALKETPWVFENEEEAAVFLQTIHNAKCSKEESLELAKKYLGHGYIDGKFYLGWSLFFLTAIK